MLNNTFYIKYRPQTVSELDIVKVRDSLEKMFKSKKIPHVLLFLGPKGTGKTSAARMVAKALCCEEIENKKNTLFCNKCDQCKTISKGTNIDVLELDAASNRGIEDARSLREAVKLSPAKSKNKVYIIDEAHMLTNDAFNALLKTLEEPPEHVYFILATTNPEKIIDTVKSRAAIIEFTKATNEELMRSVRRIITGEKIKISDADIKKVIEISGGSFRDAAKILERVSLEGVGFLQDLSLDISDVMNSLKEKNFEGFLDKCKKLYQKGVTGEEIAKDILAKIQKILNKEEMNGFSESSLIDLAENLIESCRQIKFSPIENLPLELAVYKWLYKNNGGRILEKTS